MIELVTKGGKKVGELSDDVGGSDKLIIKGNKVNLEDVYSSEELVKKFNDQAKELKDAVPQDEDTEKTTE